MSAGIDAVLSHHMNPFGSGVARFNEVLAEQLGVPFRSVFDPAVAELRHPLLSFKAGEMDAEELIALEAVLDALPGLDLFLHAYGASPVERRMLAAAGTVFCGNGEIRAALTAQGDADGARLVDAWAPGLLLDHRRFEPAEVTVFSFGMAHKLRTEMFARLRELLEASDRSYAVHISNANHETATLDDAQLVFQEMHRIFPRRLYFLGNLSDVAVYNELLTTTFFAAFFRGGARANNTSIHSAMEHGAVVVTNLDEHSPPYLRHMDNVIDLQQCDALPFDPLVLRRISVRAMETAREHGWDRLVGLLAGSA
ncbi:MAG TPA: hypothetical protein VN238_04715 [Solirubrobacteraceae bacterium]|nr:hypothetical protein [Solirubrobacteraceae bacterium]